MDSGNLAGHLLTLRAGLIELADSAPRATPLLDGLADTLHLLTQADDRASPGGTPDGALGRFTQLLNDARRQPAPTVTLGEHGLAQSSLGSEQCCKTILDWTYGWCKHRDNPRSS